jgi:hypothetical protein
MKIFISWEEVVLICGTKQNHRTYLLSNSNFLKYAGTIEIFYFNNPDCSNTEILLIM